MIQELEFYETEEMNKLYEILTDMNYLDSKELDDIYCRATNEEDLRYEFDAHIENVFEEVEHLIEKYYELFGKRLEHPSGNWILWEIKWNAKCLKRAVELKEEWKDSRFLSGMAEERYNCTKAKAKMLSRMYRNTVGIRND